MRKDWKYILYLSLVIGVFVLVKLMSPKQFDWSITLAHDDKNPYGTYALNELLPGLFPHQAIRHSFATLYEELDSTKQTQSIVVLASTFNAAKEDADALLNYVSLGNTAFISAEYFAGPFADTLRLETYDFLFQVETPMAGRDTLSLRYANPLLDSARKYAFSSRSIHNYFDRYDSSRSAIVAFNELNQPVTIRVNWGKGQLLLNTTPLVFTNINLLSKDNHGFASKALSFLPSSDILWTEYYQRGRLEAETPLRFILTHEPLTWAYYITLVSLLLFIVFEAKRRQRIIPIIEPLRNTTLEFVTTVGTLYYNRGDHRNLAEKEIEYFLDQLRQRYWLDGSVDSWSAEVLSRKTGNDELVTSQLLALIKGIQQRSSITAEELLSLNQQIENFLTPKQHGRTRLPKSN